MGVDAGALARRGERALHEVGDLRTARRWFDPHNRITHLQTALALWRGQPLMDAAESSWMDAQAARLDQLRLNGQLALAEARLALGQHHQAVPDLERLTHDHPLNEHIHAQSMLAFYRAGRQNESLNVYQRLRSALDELGIQPTPALRDLQAAVLRQDTALSTPLQVNRR